MSLRSRPPRRLRNVSFSEWLYHLTRLKISDRWRGRVSRQVEGRSHRKLEPGAAAVRWIAWLDRWAWHEVMAVHVQMLFERDEFVVGKMISEDLLTGDEILIRNPAGHVVACGRMLRNVLVEAHAGARKK